MLKCIQKVKESTSFTFRKKMSLLDFSASFLTLRLLVQKFKEVKLFANKAALFDFSGSFALVHFSGKTSKRQTFRKKLHFSQKFTFRRFGSFLTLRLLVQKFKKSNFSEKVALFEFSVSFLTFRLLGQKIEKVQLFAKSYTFRLFAQLSHFSTFRATSQKVLLFAHKMAFFDFSGKKSKSFYLSQKLTSFRAVISLFDFSGSFALFDFLGSFLTFGRFAQKNQKVELLVKGCTFRQLIQKVYAELKPPQRNSPQTNKLSENRFGVGVRSGAAGCQRNESEALKTALWLGGQCSLV